MSLQDIQLYKVVLAPHRVADLMALEYNVHRVRTAEGHDEGIVARYAAMAPGTAPPITLRKEPKGWRVVDGGHRLAAAIRRGDEFINTREFPCE